MSRAGAVVASRSSIWPCFPSNLVPLCRRRSRRVRASKLTKVEAREVIKLALESFKAELAAGASGDQDLDGPLSPIHSLQDSWEIIREALCGEPGDENGDDMDDPDREEEEPGLLEVAGLDRLEWASEDVGNFLLENDIGNALAEVDRFLALAF